MRNEPCTQNGTRSDGVCSTCRVACFSGYLVVPSISSQSSTCNTFSLLSLSRIVKCIPASGSPPGFPFFFLVPLISTCVEEWGNKAVTYLISFHSPKPSIQLPSPNGHFVMLVEVVSFHIPTLCCCSCHDPHRHPTQSYVYTTHPHMYHTCPHIYSTHTHTCKLMQTHAHIHTHTCHHPLTEYLEHWWTALPNPSSKWTPQVNLDVTVVCMH